MRVRELLRKIKAQGWFLLEHGTEHDHWTHELIDGYVPIIRRYSEEVSAGIEHRVKKLMREIEKKKRGK
ncbi:MAG: hypothetical protein RDV48_23990 [Candidatus Eremiobacteraeota bacterium]|nr:hypothetical protein [Candidatus Eremiobacteraeota bacterium]